MSQGWQKGLEKFPRLVPEFELDAKKTALLVIDMQNASAHPEYGWGVYLKEKMPEVHSYYYGRLARTVIPNNARLLGFFRENGLRVIYLALGSMLPDGSDLTPLRKRRPGSLGSQRWPGSFGYQILDEIKPRQGELVMHKSAGNAFNSSPVDQTLRNMGMECLVVTGVVSFACVEITARDAADRGYRTVIVEDAAAGWNQDQHDATMRVFASIYGRVAATDEVCAELAKQVRAPARAG